MFTYSLRACETLALQQKFMELKYNLCYDMQNYCYYTISLKCEKEVDQTSMAEFTVVQNIPSDFLVPLCGIRCIHRALIRKLDQVKLYNIIWWLGDNYISREIHISVHLEQNVTLYFHCILKDAKQNMKCFNSALVPSCETWFTVMNPSPGLSKSRISAQKWNCNYSAGWCKVLSGKVQ